MRGSFDLFNCVLIFGRFLADLFPKNFPDDLVTNDDAHIVFISVPKNPMAKCQTYRPGWVKIDYFFGKLLTQVFSEVIFYQSSLEPNLIDNITLSLLSFFDNILLLR